MMPPESLLEELNHKEPAGISQTKGMEVGGGSGEGGRERESKEAEKMESKEVQRQERMWNI